MPEKRLIPHLPHILPAWNWKFFPFVEILSFGVPFLDASIKIIRSSMGSLSMFFEISVADIPVKILIHL